MFLTTRLRIIRHRHKISLVELAAKAGMNHQKISNLELAKQCASAHHEEMVDSALASVIAERKIDVISLEQEYLKSKGHLLKPIEVECDEL